MRPKSLERKRLEMEVPTDGLVCILLTHLNMKKVIAFGIVFAPMFAFAQLSVENQNLLGVVNFLSDVLEVAVWLITAAAVVWFIWGVFMFIQASGVEEGRSEGRKRMVAGIIGIAVIVSVWGLVAWITNTTGTDGREPLRTVGLPLRAE